MSQILTYTSREGFLRECGIEEVGDGQIRGNIMVNWSELRAQHLGTDAGSILPPHIKMPMLPHAVLQFTQKANDPDVAAKDLAAIIETDAGLTCELLKYVNSSGFGLRRPAASAQQALALLGIRPAKLFLLTQGVKTGLSSRESKLVNLQNFWTTNLERALFAREVAGLLRADADLAFAGAMLQDAMLPVLTQEFCDHYVRYLEMSEQEAPALHAFETKQFRWDHAFVGAQIMRTWEFPDDLVCAVLFHHRGVEILCDPLLGKSAVAAVAISSLIPDQLKQVRGGLRQLLMLAEVWPEFHLLEIAERVEQQVMAMQAVASAGNLLRKRLEKALLAAKAAV